MAGFRGAAGSPWESYYAAGTCHARAIIRYLLYCQGGFDFDRLCTLDKLAMRAFFRMQAKAAETDPRTAFALKAMMQGFDGTNRAYLQPVLDYLGA